ncbi:hypothetical protein [Collinsella sp. D33t1_170424_A12]|uniref:hypothetical protein n=1 Tax=Collinsella sp. D33t1_170424_A12 TaxID=2787135 RepID=UPI001898E537|nr:hypothetical protein [Collinsella sp. D33t1_170424_A12]
MALYLPKQHLAIEVVDDPESAPVDPDAFPELSVATVTVDQLANPQTISWYAQRAMGHALRREAAIRDIAQPDDELPCLEAAN